MAVIEVATALAAGKAETRWLWLIAKIFLPFAFAYFLSYLLRNLNAVIAPRLIEEFSIDALQLGSLTASYFLGFAIMQIPVGICLDRFSPPMVQASLYMVAAAGAALFGNAHSPTELLASRLLIGIGVAGGLVAGMKSIALWFPRDRIAVVNGAFIAMGSLGGVGATAPAEWMLAGTDWRRLFLFLAVACASVAIVFWWWVPRMQPQRRDRAVPIAGYGDVLRDPRLWRLAPLSGLSIGSAWALQGLWAGPWLADVGGFNRSMVVGCLFAMSIALSLGALGLGAAIRLLKVWAIGPAQVLAGLVTCLMLSELAIALHLPLPPVVPWCVVAFMAAGTVATYSITAALFDTSVLGRVNGVINLFHIGCAFLMQSGIGLLLAQWHQTAPGQYPAAAYSQAFLVLFAIQLLALIWYLTAGASLAMRPRALRSRA
jgi:MFS family permease